MANRYPTLKPGDVVGHIEAIDPLTGKPKWRVPLQGRADLVSPCSPPAAGCCSPASTAASSSRSTRETGETLWEFKTGSGVNAKPITWTHNGKQYVTVLSGLGGLYGSTTARQTLPNMPLGGSIWVFALPD